MKNRNPFWRQKFLQGIYNLHEPSLEQLLTSTSLVPFTTGLIWDARSSEETAGAGRLAK